MDNTSRHPFPRWGWAVVSVVAVLAGLWLISETAVFAKKEKKASADAVPAPGIMAMVGETAITEAELKEVLASDLKRIERERHELLQQGLENLITEKLLEVEAQARGVAVEELIAQEVESKIGDVTEEEVAAFYETQKDRINRPQEQVADQIRQYLGGQQRQQAQQTLLASLREKHAVQSFLEPMRVEVDAAGAPSNGPDNAPVTIVEFSDFQCPFCSRVVPTLDRVTSTYGDKVRLVFRQFPLHQIHPLAQKAAEASLCAADQDKFWEMHDALFADQGGLGVGQLKEKAGGLGLDRQAFDDCLDSDRHAERVNQDLQAGVEAGVSGTPAMFVNGRFLSGAQPFEDIAKVIDEELRRAGG